MDKVRLGIIGVGGMGCFHADYIKTGSINGLELVAACDIDPEKLTAHPDLKQFSDHKSLIESGEVDAVLIATPHFAHTYIGIDALNAGLHVLCEKPISVHVADCKRLIAAHTNPAQIFAAMFNQRNVPVHIKLKQMIDNGELGEITRVNWIVTDWFRTEAYYSSGSWRATWKGEGGGVLLNQCPHQLDLMQWLFGMPTKVRAFCAIGAKHDIEVEDEVTAYLEYANGATGVFITTTGEAPGTNRLEIAGDRGKVVLENNRICFTRNETLASEFSKTSSECYVGPPTWNIEIPTQPAQMQQHMTITQNFTDAILNGTPLIAPAEEGIKSVELANSMLYSSMKGTTIELPIDNIGYEEMLKGLMATSRYPKVEQKNVNRDMSKSFGK
ncbi:MAG: Gfo/Idh/MocA family oxidoreductase [Armatimonadetes bacterium]|nr:Gfo/Idh/MocA family oxidoreductase [Armatimonadota bacterium]